MRYFNSLRYPSKPPGGGAAEHIPPFVMERLKHFVGRKWVFRQVESWLNSSGAPSYFIITGEPGIGKTDIAARLAQIHNPAAIHFCIARQSITVDPVDFARSLSRQLGLIKGFWRGVLEDTGTRVEGRASAEQNYNEVIGVKIENLIINAPSASGAFNRTVVAPLRNLYETGFDQQLVFIIDALDEAAQVDRESIIDLVANTRGLPNQVRFILTSRPESRVLRHFDAKLIPYLLLDAGGRDNKQDVRRYVTRQLKDSESLRQNLTGDYSAEEFVNRVASASRGNFLYLTWLLQGIAKGTQSLDRLEDLPEGLDGIYREFLRTRRIGMNQERWQRNYRNLFGVLVAARSHLTLAELKQFTGLDEQTISDILEDAQQFLSPAMYDEGKYQLFHQSVADFFTRKEKAQEYWVDTKAVHGRIARSYVEKHKSGWQGCGEYGLRNLPTHLKRAGEKQLLKDLLLDYGWVETKLASADVRALVADYDHVPEDADLRLVRDAIGLAAQVLSKDKAQLPSQLWGRLAGCGTVRIAQLLERVRHSRTAAWLRPVRTKLTRPGGPLVRTLIDDGGNVIAMEMTPEGDRAVSTSGEGALRVWDVEGGTELGILSGHSNPIRALAVTPDGKLAVSASSERKMVSNCEEGGLLTHGVGKNEIKVWDLEGLGERYAISDHGYDITDVAVTPDGRYIAAGAYEGTVYIWEPESSASARILHHVKDPPPLPGRTRDRPKRTLAEDFVSPIAAVALTADGKRVTAVNYAGEVMIWEEVDPTKPSIIVLGDEISAAAIAQGGRWIAYVSRGNSLVVYDTESGAKAHPIRQEHGRLSAVTMTPTCKLIAAASYGGILKVWEVESSREIQTIQGHEGAVTAIALTQNGARLASAAEDRTIKIWDLRADVELQESVTPSKAINAIAVAMTPNGGRVISASEDMKIRVSELETGAELYKLRGHQYMIRAVAVTPDGGRAVSASHDRMLKVWDLENGCELHTLAGHSNEVLAVSVSSDGERVVSVSYEGTLKIWDLKRQTVLTTVRDIGNGVTAAAITLDGGRVAAATYERVIKIWNLNGSPREHASFWVGLTTVVAITPDGRRVIYATHDQVLKILDLEQGAEIHSLRGHKGKINAVAVTPNGKRIVSASEDRTIRVWDLESFNHLATFSSDTAILCVSAFDEGAFVAGDRAGNVHFLILEGFE